MPSSPEQTRCMQATPSPGDVMPLAAFFAQFASFSFKFNENQSSNKNFDRLIRVLRRSPEDSPGKRVVRDGFNDALVQEFNERFGTDGNNIANWQNLCHMLRIVPVPNKIKACRKCVWDTHVNLVDLVDSARTGKPLKLFASLEELKTYTLGRPGKIFPKENAYQGMLLKELLRELTNPYNGARGMNGSAKKKDRKKKQKVPN